MFISNKICFLELEKTGISSIKKFLKNHIREGKITSQNDYVTDEILNKKLFFLGSIRNPLDWYVSRWSYGCMTSDDSLFRNFVKKRFSINRIDNIDGQYFKKIKYLKNQLFKNNTNLKNLYSDPYNKDNFKIWLKELLTNKKNSPLAEHYYFSSLYLNFGYMTFRYLIMFTKPNQRKKLFSEIKNYQNIIDFDKNYNFINKFLKVENLKYDLESVIQELGIDKTKEIEIVNPSRREKKLDYYYDSETLEIVKKQDKFIFDKFNY